MTTQLGTPSDRDQLRPRPPRHALVALNGLRGVAILWVVLYHLDMALPEILHGGTDGPFMAFVHGIVSRGSLGVDVFFLVSGFVLWWNYADVLGHFTWSGSVLFLRARLARVYPVYVLCLTVFIVAAAVLARPGSELRASLTPWRIAADYLLIQTWVDSTYLLGVTWALSALFGMYLLFPLMVPALARIRSARLRLAVLTALIVGLFVAMLTVPEQGYIVRVGVEFPAGCVLAMLFMEARRPRLWGLVGDVAAFALLAHLGFLGDLLVHSTAPSHYRDSLVVAGVRVFLALMVVGCASGTGLLGSVMSRRPLLAVGAVSYSVFITHILVIRALDGTLLDLVPVSSAAAMRLALICVYALAIAAAAILTYRLIEDPLRRTWRGSGERARPVRETASDAA